MTKPEDALTALMHKIASGNMDLRFNTTEYELEFNRYVVAIKEFDEAVWKAHLAEQQVTRFEKVVADNVEVIQQAEHGFRSHWHQKRYRRYDDDDGDDPDKQARDHLLNSYNGLPSAITDAKSAQDRKDEADRTVNDKHDALMKAKIRWEAVYAEHMKPAG